ncbi:TetR/AcrR family transcriptional regulator [Aureimonas populi]|uniref:TetR/AcrR family transcriptional regulator n=2 Tax=Aureimonas populi TaxID=1701758 RepID=A0ABW5CNP8_9HYPH
MTLTAKAEATRRTILDTGHRLVLGRGFTGLGLQEILKESGVPKGSFYHYFPSKEAFGCALLADYVETYAARLEELTEGGGTGKDRLMRYWHAWMSDPSRPDGRGWGEECLVVKLGAEVADLSDDMRRVLSNGVERVTGRLAAMIGEARADGSLPPGAEAAGLAQVLYQMWLGAALLARLSRDKGPMRHALGATERLLLCEPEDLSGKGHRP